MKRKLVNLAFFFCFFPFLKVLPIEAETQPIAGIIALVILLIYGVKRTRYSIALLWLVYVVIGYYFITITFRPFLIPKIALHTIAHLIPLFVFLALYDKMNLLSVKLYFLVLLLWLGLGLIQSFDFASPLKVLTDVVLGHLIADYQSSSFGGARGVAFFSQEPSAGANIVVLLMLTGVFFYTVGRISKRSMWLAVTASIVMAILNKSGTVGFLVTVFALGLFVGYLVALAKTGRMVVLMRKFVCIAAVAAILIAGLLMLVSKFQYSSRFVNVAKIVYNDIIVRKQLSFYVMAKIGGFRFLTVYVGYRSIFDNFGLGHGIASYLTEFDRMAKAAGVVFSDYPLRESERWLKVVKPDSYSATVALDVGVVGLLPLLSFLGFFLFSKPMVRLGPGVLVAKWGMLFVGLLRILLLGFISLPMPWLVLCYVYHLNSSDDSDHLCREESR